MKKLLATVTLLISLCSSFAMASVIDAPHNETFNLSCGSCHNYSLWWQYSPLSAYDPISYKNTVNSLCLHCHDGSNPQISTMQPHSSDILGTKYGAWVTSCTDCHDPHRQNQLLWRSSSASDLYLVTGTIAQATPNAPQSGQTTISYTTYIVNNQNWSTPNSPDPSAITWEKKNASSPTTGLTFVHDSTNALNTFSIVSVDSATQTIVVQGILDPTEINPTSKPTSNSFGLIYGQLIKDQIISTDSGTSHSVKFFDPSFVFTEGKIGGYVANLSLSRQGICQACHLNTNYWNENGSSDSHYTGTTCTTCHEIKNGFKKNLNNTDHSANGFGYVLDSPECVSSCHQANNPLLVHNSVCVDCHESVQTIPALADYTTRKYVTAIPLGGGSCKTCHSTYSDFTSHQHDHTASVLVAQNPTQATENCQGCHNATSAPFIGAGQVHSAIPAGQTSPCANCHNISDASRIGSATNFTSPAAPCNECHANYFNSHKHGTTTEITHWIQYDPARDLSAGEACGVRCHTGEVESWDNIKTRHMSSGLCGTCHNSTRTNGGTITVNPAYGSIANAIAQAGATNSLTLSCIDCHANKGTNHTPDHSLFVAGGTTTCVTNCHTASFVTDANDPKVHDNCKTCHAGTYAPVTLKGSALGHADQDPGFGNPNTCATCHASKTFWTHTNINNHTGQVQATSNGTCETCHPNTGDLVTNTKLHKSNCGLCHNLGNEGVLMAGINGRGSAVNGQGDCASCHTAYAADFYFHISFDHNIVTVKPKHDTPVLQTTAKCVGCHNESDRAIGIHKTNTCGTCHALTTGVLIAGTNGDATGGPNSCAGCHPQYDAAFLNHQGPVDHNTANILATASCVTCHDEADRATGIHHTNLCDTCHTPGTGVLVSATNGDASKGAGDCVNCHQSRGTNYTNHLAPSHATLTKTPGCTTTCHTGANLITDIHKNTCTNCHTATTGVLKGSAANGPGDCEFCHTLIDPADPHTAQHDHIIFDDSPALPCANCHATTNVSGHIGRTTENGPITCTSCHDPNNAVYQDKIYWGKQGVSIYCRECHVSYRAGNHPRDVQPDHKAKGYVTTAATCATCHDPAGSTDLIVLTHQDNCNNCHDATNFSLTGSAVGHQGGGDCAVCHGAALHDTTAVHNFRAIGFGTGPSCSNCHTSDATNLGQPGSGALTSQADIDSLHQRVTGNACNLCHNYNPATQANTEGLPLLATVNNAITAGKNGTATATCVTCHDYNQTGHGNIDHVALGKVTASAKCVSCHDQAGQGDNTMYILTIHNKSGNGCGTCHVNPSGAGPLKAAYEAINGGQGGTCVTCHTNYDLDFGIAAGAGHQNEDHALLSGLTNCTSCHGGDLLINVHGNGTTATCLKCHTAVDDGTLRAGANLWGDASTHIIGAAATCASCHPAHAANFESGHQREDHASLASTPSCATCHTGNLITSTQIHNSLCSDCHTNTTTNGTLRIGARGWGNAAGGPGTCSTCHPTYFDAHVHGTLGGYATHTVALQPTDLAQEEPGTQCSYCHGPLNTMDDIKALHDVPTNGAGPCATCHNATRDVNPDALTGTTINMVIAANANPTGCLDCHANKAKPAIHYVLHTTYVTADPSCTTAQCHPEGSLLTGLHDVQKCTTCHTNTHQPVAPMKGSAINHATTDPGFGNPNTCTTCHATVTTHDVDASHDMLSMAPNCAIACHSHPGSTFNEIYTTHRSDCQTCHGSGYQKVKDAIAAGRSRSGNPIAVTCETCHPVVGTIQHGDTSHNNLNSASFILRDCKGCHSSSNFTGFYGIHKSKCLSRLHQQWHLPADGTRLRL